MTQPVEPDFGVEREQPQLSLTTAAARNLTTTTKSPPQMQGISSRWLLRMLPWVEVSGGTFRVNRRLSCVLGDGRVTFISTGAEVRVAPRELRELPLLREFDHGEVLAALAGRFVQREVEPGDVVAEYGQPADQVFLIVHGKMHKVGPGKFGDQVVLGALADGEYFGDHALVGAQSSWEFTVKAVTAGTLLALPRQSFQALVGLSEELRAHIERFQAGPRPARNTRGEASIEVASGHTGEPELPRTFVDYEVSPREYELSVAQTVLRVHSRVSDLYNEPMNQIEQQLRLTIEALRERQERELVNNRDFGLLYNVDHRQRIHTHSGPPTPDDLDELLSTQRDTRLLLAHPRAIAAFGRECSGRGISPDSVEVKGHEVPAWRGVPIFPCGKIPVTDQRVSSILALRTGEDDQGVIGLYQTGIPDEYEPGLNVRFMGISAQAVISYLVSTYFSAAVLVPDALSILETVEVSRPPA